MRALVIPLAAATVPAAAAATEAGHAAIAGIRRAARAGVPARAARHVVGDQVFVFQPGKVCGRAPAPADPVSGARRWTAVRPPIESNGVRARTVSVGGRGREGGRAGRFRVPRLWRADHGDHREPFARATARLAE